MPCPRFVSSFLSTEADSEKSSDLDWVQTRGSARSTYCQLLILSISLVGIGGMSSITADIAFVWMSCAGGNPLKPVSKSAGPPDIPQAGREGDLVPRCVPS